jgi:hypothetical protein
MLRKSAIYIMALFTLCTAILPGQGMAELQKIPMLIGHYQHHLEEHDGDQLSFTSFLWMHYGDSSKHKTEESHEDLPLYHQCCACQFFIGEERLEFLAIGRSETPSHSEHLSDTYFHQSFSVIFQPPRFS